MFVVGISCLKLTKYLMKILIVLTKDRQLEIRLQSIKILYECAVILLENLSDLEANKLVTKYLIPALNNLSQDSEVKCKLEVLAVLAKLGKIISHEL